jgi:hypothetical protein
VKIDTEGFEQQVLTGLADALTRHRPCVIVELTHGLSSSYADLESLRTAFPADYRLFGITGVHNGYKFRLCELSTDNLLRYRDIVALPVEQTGEFVEFMRSYPFYTRPSDLPRLVKAAVMSLLRTADQ